MFVTEMQGMGSRFVGCLGFMLAIVVGPGCSTSDQPAVTGATTAGGSTSTTGGGMDDDGSSGPDAPGWTAACRAVTPPAPACPCICRECGEVTALCFGSPDCPPIVDCVQRTGCRSSAECLGACASEIASHMAGVSLAQNFRSCFYPMCASACVLPDASTDSSDGSPEAATDASEEASTSGGTGEASASDAEGEAGAD